MDWPTIVVVGSYIAGVTSYFKTRLDLRKRNSIRESERGNQNRNADCNSPIPRPTIRQIQVYGQISAVLFLIVIPFASYYAVASLRNQVNYARAAATVARDEFVSAQHQLDELKTELQQIGNELERFDRESLRRNRLMSKEEAEQLVLFLKGKLDSIFRTD